MPDYRRARTPPLANPAVPDDCTEAQSIELNSDDVHQTDVAIEVRRWTDGFYSELSLTEVRRRFANTGLHLSTDESQQRR